MTVYCSIVYVMEGTVQTITADVDVVLVAYMSVGITGFAVCVHMV